MGTGAYYMYEKEFKRQVRRLRLAGSVCKILVSTIGLGHGSGYGTTVPGLCRPRSQRLGLEAASRRPDASPRSRGLAPRSRSRA